MNLITIVLTAFGLSMDAFAVSVTNGIMLRNVKLENALKVGLFFGFFQGIMPLIGWLVGINLEGYITKIDHWIAFILLGLIGGKMIYETLKPEETIEECDSNACEVKVLSNKTLTLMAIATSIDALAVGVSFAFLKVSILKASAIIGLITFILCTLGVLIGKICGSFLKKNAELVGGVVLILIGFNIFAEHTNLISVFTFLK
ncbi:manganese efflux pump MntP family protein [Clostridium sp.]|uniref:manganese efflux pump MntP n=1 Tax=Clostridium sp. TaxID=1506 RepID=UPI002FC9D4F8